MPLVAELFETESDKKLKELILYVALRSENDEKFGAVKLNKLLFYSDFIAYLTLGKAITGADYFALEEGPAPRRLLPLKEAMLNANEISVRTQALPGFANPKERITALRAPNLKLFGGDEIALVDSIIDQFRQKTGTDLSKESHNFIGWKASKLKETIPYATAMFDAGTLCGTTPPEIPENILEYAKSLEPLALEALNAAV